MKQVFLDITINFGIWTLEVNFNLPGGVSFVRYYNPRVYHLGLGIEIGVVK
jgi:hypothetical protein